MLPKELKDQKFTLVAKRDKIPVEKNWTRNNYSYHSKKLQQHISEGGNYAVITGDGLVVLDADTDRLNKWAKENLPETFTVKTGRGHHYYYKSDLQKKKILVDGPTHLGEIQAKGQCVIGPGSIHPSGKIYTVSNKRPIATFSKEQIQEKMSHFFQRKKGIDRKKVIMNGAPQGNRNDAMFTIACRLRKDGLSIFDAFQTIQTINQKNNPPLPEHEVKTAVESAYSYKKKKSEKLKKAISQFDNKIHLAEEFLSVQPLYYDRSKIWWKWDNQETKWQLTDETDILNMIKKNSYANTVNSKQRNEILEALRQEARLNQPKEGKKTWVQFRDKIIDLENYNTFRATPEYFITNPIPWKTGDSNETPMMDKFFAEWVGEDNVKTLYQIIAYCCLPDYPIHRIFCFMGAGCNGKGQFLKLLRNFIGPGNCTSTELDTLLNSRFEKTRLYKKLVCQIGETNFNEMSQTSLLKQLSGGDLIGFEFKNKDPFESENYAKIVIATNTLPPTTDKTMGFYRRWMIVDFPNQFPEDRGDIIDYIPNWEYNNLASKSLQILSKLMQTYRFHKEGTIAERAEKYEERSNPFGKFWKENIVENFDGHIFKFEFRKELADWCRTHGFRKLSNREIKHKMDERNIDDGRRDYFGNETGESKRYRAWLGISWKGKDKKQEPPVDFLKYIPDNEPIKLNRIYEQYDINPAQVEKAKEQGLIAETKPGHIIKL